VFLPGLGAPGYLRPWLDRTRRWADVRVLDLPGWQGGRARRCPPTIAGIATATERWLAAQDGRPPVLVGHSTAAQSAAVVAAIAPQRLAGVVLAGPVFDPAIRGWRDLFRRALRTAAHESPMEVAAILPKYLRGGVLSVVRLLQDGLRAGASPYRPLAAPAVVLTGRHDHFAPPAWTAELAGRIGADHAVLPGGHNFCFTHPVEADRTLRAVVAPWAAN